MRNKIIIILLAVTSSSFAQDNSIYKGGLSELFKYVGENIQLTSEDRTANIDGVVVVKFKIDGSSIDSVTVINNITNSIDKEVIRVMKSTNGSWVGGVTSFYLLEIKYTIGYQGKLDVERLKKKLEKAIIKDNAEDIELYRNEIRRQTPFDIENLTQLAEFYRNLGRNEEAALTQKLVDELNYFSEQELVIRPK